MRLLIYILLPLQMIYSLIIIIRNKLYDYNILHQYQAPCHIISIGNLKTGGTGKTPLVEYLIDFFKTEKIAILSRGYKRETTGFILANNATNNASDIGDENCQLYNKFNNILIGCDRNRVNGVRKLLMIDNKIKIIILDDGYQHRSLKRDLNILLTEYDNLFTNDSLIPIGNLREHKTQKKRSDIIIVTKCPKNISKEKKTEIEKKILLSKNQKLYFSYIKNYVLINMATLKEHTISKDKEYILVTGIENTQPLTQFLSEEKIKFSHFSFKDHHYFQENDLEKMIQLYQTRKMGKELLLTEKDFFRLSNQQKKQLKKHFILICVQINVDFINPDKSHFNNQLFKFGKTKIT